MIVPELNLLNTTMLVTICLFTSLNAFAIYRMHVLARVEQQCKFYGYRLAPFTTHIVTWSPIVNFLFLGYLCAISSNRWVQEIGLGVTHTHMSVFLYSYMIFCYHGVDIMERSNSRQANPNIKRFIPFLSFTLYIGGFVVDVPLGILPNKEWPVRAVSLVLTTVGLTVVLHFTYVSFRLLSQIKTLRQNWIKMNETNSSGTSRVGGGRSTSTSSHSAGSEVNPYDIIIKKFRRFIIILNCMAFCACLYPTVVNARDLVLGSTTEPERLEFSRELIIQPSWQKYELILVFMVVVSIVEFVGFMNIAQVTRRWKARKEQMAQFRHSRSGSPSRTPPGENRLKIPVLNLGMSQSDAAGHIHGETMTPTMPRPVFSSDEEVESQTSLTVSSSMLPPGATPYSVAQPGRTPMAPGETESGEEAGAGGGGSQFNWQISSQDRKQYLEAVDGMRRPTVDSPSNNNNKPTLLSPPSFDNSHGQDKKSTLLTRQTQPRETEGELESLVNRVDSSVVTLEIPSSRGSRDSLFP